MQTASFYRAFEERYYSPRHIIRRMRAQYLPFARPLAPRYPGAPTFDIGCGRGEWLELMQELGFQPLGMDLDSGMLEDCHAHDLPARQGDAIANLASLPDRSQAIISAFHVVEHLSFEQLWEILTHSLRALLPGGLLIMETPNPDNLRVATHNFYLDPTHRQPLPAMLLSFLAEYHGFNRVLVRPLQESPELRNKADPTLTEVITGASPDYAVIAQTVAVAAVLKPFDAAFATEGGLELQELASRYDAASQRRIQRANEELAATLDNRIQRANEDLTTYFEAVIADRIQHVNEEFASNFDTLGTHFEAVIAERIQRTNEEFATHYAAIERRIQGVSTEMASRQDAAHNEIVQNYQRLVDQLATHRADLLASTSWRITAPLRGLSHLLRKLTRLLRKLTRTLIVAPARLLLVGAIKTTSAVPALRTGVARLLLRYAPTGYDWLLRFAQRRGLLADAALSATATATTTATNSNTNRNPPETAPLSPNARRYRADLQQARADLQQARAAHQRQEAN